jgi:hypothetical protein
MVRDCAIATVQWPAFMLAEPRPTESREDLVDLEAARRASQWCKRLAAHNLWCRVCVDSDADAAGCPCMECHGP